MANEQNDMKNWRKKVSYVILGMYFFFEGIEYAVILPTLWMYLQISFKAEQFFLGLVLSVFSMACMISGPLFGRWTDVKRKPKITIVLGSVFGIIGNFMYFVGISKWFITASRFIAGIGMGAETVMLAEISRVTTEKERTGVLSTMILIRQSGLLFGPGFNVFLRLADFKIGPFVVNKYTVPGAFMACLWLLEFFLLITCYTDLHRIKDQEMAENSTELVLVNTKLIDDNSKPYDCVTDNCGNDSISNKIDHIENGNKCHNSAKKNDVVKPCKTEKITLKFLYKTYIKEEVVTLLAVKFISAFCQVAVETMATPFSAKLLHWGELENSILFCGAAVEMIIVFIAIKIMSRYLKDRTMILIGSCLLTVANVWLIYFIPQAVNDTPEENLPKFIVGVFLDVLALPFLLTCSTSLYTKILPKEIQGLSQGVQTTTVMLAIILAPLWTGSTLQWPYVMLGVILGLLGISLVMLLLSFDRLLPPSMVEVKCVSENSPGFKKDIHVCKYISKDNISGSNQDICNCISKENGIESKKDNDNCISEENSSESDRYIFRAKNSQAFSN